MNRNHVEEQLGGAHAPVNAVPPELHLHPSTFEYLKPTDDQLDVMEHLRDEAARYASEINVHLPEGPDKTYALRKFREVAMWVNIAVTRNSDGSPRLDDDYGADSGC